MGTTTGRRASLQHDESLGQHLHRLGQPGLGQGDRLPARRSIDRSLPTALRHGRRYLRLTAAEKREVIRLVEGSDLSVRRTLRELGVGRSTFYAWYERYRERGDLGLEPRSSATRRHWNRVPDRERRRVVEEALADPRSRRASWRGR